MASYNKVILVGNMTRDPQLSYLPSGTPVCEFGIATNRKWKGQDGQMKEETCFVDCRCFNRGAETINQYMTKGQAILVDGHLRLDQWESKEGQKRSKLYVVVDTFQFMGGPRREGGRGDEEGSGGKWPRAAGARTVGASAPAPIEDDSMPPVEDPGRNDIPF